MAESPATQGATLPYRPALDGLRAFAILSVLIFHLDRRWLPGGFIGVDVFFVISGFLITSVILREHEAGCFGLARFYQRRIARIIPPFFTVAAATLAAACWVYSPQDAASAGANFSAAALSLANIKSMFQGDYFTLSPDAQPFLHYWSLSVEEQFYFLFPFLMVLMRRCSRRQKLAALGVLTALSLLACIVMTRIQPVWAFYLPPTRAWELLAGCVLAVAMSDSRLQLAERWRQMSSCLGLVLITAACFCVAEGTAFPGFQALLPVAGAIGVLIPPSHRESPVERWLAIPPLVHVGRLSYSLYLWHWPVFAIIDYALFLTPGATRLGLKLLLSFTLAHLSFTYIERPARTWLNRPNSRTSAFALLFCAVALSVPLGFRIRNREYVTAEGREVSMGGRVFNPNGSAGSVVLMGDSHGAMYGRLLRDICTSLDRKLNVISVAAGDPLPSTRGDPGSLWLDSLAVVRKEKPDFLIIACNWESKLGAAPDRLDQAIDALKPHVHHIILLNQPPVLPPNADRASIRRGARPPFLEDQDLRQRRDTANEYLERFSPEPCTVVNVAAHFLGKNHEILFLNSAGRQLYHDRSHLSGHGAELIRPELVRMLSR